MHHPRTRARLLSLLGIAMLLLSGIVSMPATGVARAEDAPPVLILPIDQAEFLPGQAFDMQVEVWAETLPADFAVTINGKDVSEVFGSQPITSTWQFDAASTSNNAATYTSRLGLTGAITATAATWPNVALQDSGAYTVAVTAGGNTTTVNWTVPEVGAGEAKNIVLFVGDGMSNGVRTATRLVSRNLNKGGKYNGELNMDDMPVMGLISTNGYDSIVTDSANSMSAYMTGQKGVVNSLGVYANTSDANEDDPRVATLAELAKQRGMSIGACVTSRVTDATPAATFGHTRRRGDEDILIDQALKLGVDVILGGGSIFFQPQSVAGSERKDEEDTFKAFEDAGYKVITSATELKDLDTSAVDKLLGIFSASHMNVWIDRNLFPENTTKNGPDQPGLMEMCTAAIDILSKNPNGFFLLVEGSDIDKQVHSMDWQRAIADTIEFDNVVGYVKDWAAQNGDNTLIAVTADHGHAFDVYGTIDIAKYDKLAAELSAAAALTATADITASAAITQPTFPAPDPRLAAVGVYQNAGMTEYKPGADNFPETWDVAHPLAVAWGAHPPYTDDFKLSKVPADAAIVPKGGTAMPNPKRAPDGIFFTGNLGPTDPQDVHTLQDVPITATGPGSECLNGWQQNTDVFFCLANAIGLDPRQSPSPFATK